MGATVTRYGQVSGLFRGCPSATIGVAQSKHQGSTKDLRLEALRIFTECTIVPLNMAVDSICFVRKAGRPMHRIVAVKPASIG